MAVVGTPNLLYAGQTGAWSWTKRSYKAGWRVTVDDPFDDQVVVLTPLAAAYFGRPWVGLTNGYDILAFCNNMEANREPETRLSWIVEGTWETPAQPNQNNQNENQADHRDNDGNPSDNPFDWRDKVERGSAKFTRPVETATIRTDLPIVGRPDGSDGPVINAAGDVLDPPPEKEVASGIYRITKFQSEFDEDTATQYENAVNSDSFSIRKPGLEKTFDPFQVKFEGITGQLSYHINQSGTEIRYWQIVYEMHYRKEGWRENVNNLGRNRRTAAGDPDGRGGTYSMADTTRPGFPPTMRIVDKNNRPVGKVPLDLNGQPLAAGAAATTILYSFYDELPFTSLLL